MALENLSNSSVQTSTSLESSWPNNDLHIQTGYEPALGLGGLIVVMELVYVGKIVGKEILKTIDYIENYRLF